MTEIVVTERQMQCAQIVAADPEIKPQKIGPMLGLQPKTAYALIERTARALGGTVQSEIPGLLEKNRHRIRVVRATGCIPGGARSPEIIRRIRESRDALNADDLRPWLPKIRWPDYSQHDFPQLGRFGIKVMIRLVEERG